MREQRKSRADNIHQKQIDNAKMHTCFKHYTTIDALSHIFADKQLRLSCLTMMNDPIEHERIKDVISRIYFVSSFSHEIKESIPLWRLYGHDGNGVCIEFDNLCFFQDRLLYRGIPKGWWIEFIDIIDVYYSDAHENIHENFYFQGIKVHRTGCIGYVKAKAWAYEKETRIRCKIQSSDTSDVFGKLLDGFGAEDLDMPYLYCRIPDDRLLSAKIRFNPFMSENSKKLIKGGIASLCPGFPDDHFLDSTLQSKIRI